MFFLVGKDYHLFIYFCFLLMALYHLLCLLNIHKTTFNADITSWLLLPVDSILCMLFSDIQNIFSRFRFSFKSQFESKLWEEKKKSKNQHHFDSKKDDNNINGEEVEMVMKKLGFFCSPESEKLKDSMGFDEFSKLFDEKEPSLEEVRKAFSVFDENNDGFIDAEELQKVLLVLGLKEGVELSNCRKMIRAFDDNKDGRIDFNEFVKFMENTLS